MVDRTELYEIADAIRGEGKVPSLRLVRARLRNGGSFRDVGQIFLDWCIEREFRPRPRTNDLPDALRERLAAVAAEVWRDGHRNGILAGQDERDLLAMKRDKSEALLAEALAMADGLEDERDRLQEENRSIKAAGGPAGRAETVAFWKRATREIADLMGDEEMSADGIMALATEETKAEALGLISQRWCPLLLVDKLRRANLIEEPGKDVFRRRRDAAGIEAEAPPPEDLPKPIRRSLRHLARPVYDPSDDDDLPHGADGSTEDLSVEPGTVGGKDIGVRSCQGS